jgi:Zn ribbon nucleic-acid-binding protein
MSDSLREAEIRPDELMAEQARRFEADVAWLLTQRDRFVEVDCPACDAGERAPAWRKYEMDWVRCAACATVYLSPRPAPDVMAEYYATSQNYEYWNRVIFPASEGARREKIFRPRAERIADIVQRHGHGTGAIVDVGAGYGTFCEVMLAVRTFARVIALEPEPHLAQTCRDKGLEVLQSRVEDASIDAIDGHELRGDRAPLLSADVRATLRSAAGRGRPVRRHVPQRARFRRRGSRPGLGGHRP